MSQEISPQSSPETSQENLVTRRGLLMKLGILFNGIVAVGLAVPIVRYVLSSITRGSSNAYLSWVPLGSVNEFPEGETRLATFRNPFVTPTDGKTVDTAAWVRRIAGDQFQVFAINGAHLGCPVRWFPQSGLFMCPCHGGAYYRDGSRASGPPERGLFTYPYKVEKGMVVIQAGELPTPGGSSASLLRKRSDADLVTIRASIARMPGSSSAGDCAALKDCSVFLGKKPPCA
jgi:Rieske Fe-S protein